MAAPGPLHLYLFFASTSRKGIYGVCLFGAGVVHINQPPHEYPTIKLRKPGQISAVKR